MVNDKVSVKEAWKRAKELQILIQLMSETMYEFAEDAGAPFSDLQKWWHRQVVRWTMAKTFLWHLSTPIRNKLFIWKATFHYLVYRYVTHRKEWAEQEARAAESLKAILTATQKTVDEAQQVLDKKEQ